MAVSKGFEKFSKRMIFIANRITKNMQDAVRRAAIAGDTAAVLKTPVDTARARANWIASVGAPVFREDEPPALGSGEASTAKSLNEGREVINGWTIDRGSIFLTNSVSYIQLLDDGSSNQSPQGMSKFAIQAATAELRRAKLLKGID